MISLIFSKFGMMAIASVIILSTGAYITNLWNNKTIKIEQQHSQIIQYKSDLNKLKKAIDDLHQVAKAQNDIFGDYLQKVSDLEISNNELSDSLSRAQSKLSARDMEKLKRSSHAELVLKIINKSITKQTSEWNSYGASSQQQ